jgi:hypothetical protein
MSIYFEKKWNNNLIKVSIFLIYILKRMKYISRIRISNHR